MNEIHCELKFENEIECNIGIEEDIHVEYKLESEIICTISNE